MNSDEDTKDVRKVTLESAVMLNSVQVLRKLRDDELDHLNQAVENGSSDVKKCLIYLFINKAQTIMHEQFTALIRGGCQLAIWLTARV